MSSPATITQHAVLAERVRALAEVVATCAFGGDDVADATRSVEDALARLRQRGVRVPFETSRGYPRWPSERSPVCGPLNPHAPPVEVTEEGDVVVGRMTESAAFQGPPDHAHGGHLAMVFDHLAGRVAARRGAPVVTGRLGVRYLKPTRVGRPLRFTASLREARHALVHVACAAYDGDIPTATADITFVELGRSHFERALADTQTES